tara:strand:+ start:10761 stop:12167 length:1407 start_codon:yes stop_codon:yes gene_type:complete
MNHVEISKIILKIQSDLNLTDFLFKGISLWPLIRNYFSSSLIRRKKQAEYKKNLSFIGLYRLSIVFSKCIWCFFSSYKEENKSVLFISDKIYEVNQGDSSFDRVLYGIDKELGLKECKIEKLDLSQVNFKDHKTIKYTKIQSFILLSRYLSLAIAEIVTRLSSLNKNLANFFKLNKLIRSISEIKSYLEVLGVDLDKLPVLRSCLGSYYHSLLIERYLKKRSFLKIYQANSFDPIGMSFTLAANRIGIETICCQHGGQSDNNPFFCKWDIDSYGANFFCKIYRCWDLDSSKSISTWNINNEIPAIEIVGNKWLDHKENYLLENPKLDSLRFKNKDNFNIAITLQPSFDIDINILKGLLGYNKKIKLWIRRHPSQETLPFKNLGSLISSNSRIDVTLSSSLSLIELFSLVDLHITKSSSSIYEASDAGIHTIFLSENAIDYFGEFIERGQAKYLKSIDEIYKLLDEKGI